MKTMFPIDSSYDALMKQKNLEIEDLREEILHLTRVAELSEIVASLAHEINQPLAAINVYSHAWTKNIYRSRCSRNHLS